jgi:TonB family protein
MGYQALLFCPDQKLARVVSQVFAELDFSVDPVHEPFAAVKQLMAQRYDAVVVDCENEQNASLLFRSARNSSFNQSSLAFALVEGQTGVAKAYRIGANLVLTKPINVEQAKGTLRVARGLLRKNLDAAGSNATSTTAPAAMAKGAAASAVSSTTEVASPEPAVAAARRAGWNDFSPAADAPPSAPPATTQHAIANTNTHTNADDDKKPKANSGHEARNTTVSASSPTTPPAPLNAASYDGGKNAAMKDAGKSEPGKSTLVSPKDTSATFTSVGGSAAAAAPAKDIAIASEQENKNDAAKPAASSRATPSPSVPAAVPLPNLANANNIPSFGGVGEEASGAARNKKILIAAVIVLALAVIGYFGDGKLGNFGTTKAPEPPQDSSQPTPSVKPMSSPAAAPSTTPNDVASSSTRASGRQSAAVSSTKPASNRNLDLIRTAENDESTADSQPEKRSATPKLVSSHSSRARLQVQAEDSTPPAPSLALASPNDAKLSSLMSSASLVVSKPSLATVEVSQGVSQGLLIKRVEPRYPQSALATHAQGSVQIEATIDRDGKVVNPKVVKGNSVLADAALEAVRQWRYKPYYLDGAPVEIQTQITINFKAN